MALLCFHFSPSPEVAARRMAAVAASLESSGLDVIVVAGVPEGVAGVSELDHPTPHITVIRLPQPRTLLVGFLVRAKRLLGQSEDAIPTTAAANGARKSAATLGPVNWMKNLFFHFVHTVDFYKRWSLHARARTVREGRLANVCAVIASGPPFSGVVGAWLAARRLGVPLVADFRDPLSSGYPNASSIWWFGRVVTRWLESRIVAAASAITCASPGIIRALVLSHPQAASKVHLVMNGFDGVIVPRPVTTGNRLEILFAGSLYLNRDPFQFLAALDRLLQDPTMSRDCIRVRFVGQCEAFRGKRLQDWLIGRAARDVVEILPPVPEASLKPMLREATVLLNLAQGQPRQIPAKTFEHLASGCEVLALCEPDSDTGQLIEGLPGSHRVTPDDDAALDAVLRDLYQRHVVNGEIKPVPPEVVANFSRDGQNKRLMSVLQEVVSTWPLR